MKTGMAHLNITSKTSHLWHNHTGFQTSGFFMRLSFSDYASQGRAFFFMCAKTERKVRPRKTGVVIAYTDKRKNPSTIGGYYKSFNTAFIRTRNVPAF